MRVSLFGVLCASAACGDPTAPWPSPPAEAPRIASITEWNATQPDLVQRGEFKYYNNGTLQSYIFGFLQQGQLFVTYAVSYDIRGGRLVGTNAEARDNDGQQYLDTFRWVGSAQFSYDAQGRLSDSEERSIDEGSGALRTRIASYEHDAAGRVRAIEDAEERRTFDYDPHGNVVRERTVSSGSAGLEHTYQFEQSFNPFAGWPQLYGVILINGLWGGRLSPYNVTRFDVGPRGAAMPTTRGVATYVLDSRGYPIRRTLTVTNLLSSVSPSEFVTEIAYVSSTSAGAIRP